MVLDYLVGRIVITRVLVNGRQRQERESSNVRGGGLRWHCWLPNARARWPLEAGKGLCLRASADTLILTQQDPCRDSGLQNCKRIALVALSPSVCTNLSQQRWTPNESAVGRPHCPSARLLVTWREPSPGGSAWLHCGTPESFRTLSLTRPLLLPLWEYTAHLLLYIFFEYRLHILEQF